MKIWDENLLSCSRCRQVHFFFKVNFKWPLAAGDRWSLFRGKFDTKFGWA